MNKQNKYSPSSSDQFLKKGGFKVFYIDKSNVSSIGKLIGPPKKTKKKYPSIFQQKQLQSLKQSSSFSYNFQDLELQQKSDQKIKEENNEEEGSNRKRIEKESVIPAEIQYKIREIIRMNAIQMQHQNTEAKLFRQRLQKVISSMNNIDTLSNKNQQIEEPSHIEHEANGDKKYRDNVEWKNKNIGNAIVRKNGKVARQKPMRLQPAKIINFQQKVQRQSLEINSKKSLNVDQMAGDQVCQRMTRNKIRNASLEQQSFFQLEIKPKFNKEMAESYKLKQQTKIKKEKVEQPNQKKKIKKVKKKIPNEEEFYSTKLDKKQKEILTTILVNNLPPRNPTIKHQHNCLDSDQILLKPLIKDNNLYFASQMLYYTKKNKSLNVKCTPRYFSFVSQTLKSSQNCKSIPQVPSESQIKKIKLKRNFEYTNKKTLVLDLDQTLIHSQGLYQKADKEIFPFSFEFDKTTRHYTIRNYAKQFIRNLSQKFYIVVFTSAVQGYADNILQHIDPQQKYIQHRLYRSNCYLHGQKYPYIKDLRILNRDLSQIIIVDNSLYAFWFNIDNGVPIVSFTGIQDDELRKLQKYLLLLQNVDDVRKVNRRAFHLHLYQDHQSSKDLLNSYCKLMRQQTDSNEVEVIDL